MNIFEALEKVYGKEDFGTKYKVVDKTFRGITFRYPKGLYFKCEGCGNCCIHENIGLLPEEVSKYPSKPFGNSNMFIIDKEFGQPCPYLTQDKKCSIYNDRMSICREYPWASLVTETHQTKDITTFKIMIDNVGHIDKMCNGYHLGKMELDHLKPFVGICRKRVKYLINIEKLKERFKDV